MQRKTKIENEKILKKGEIYGFTKSKFYGIFIRNNQKILGLIDRKRDTIAASFSEKEVIISDLKKIQYWFKNYCQGNGQLAKFKPFIVRVTGDNGIVCNIQDEITKINTKHPEFIVDFKVK